MLVELRKVIPAFLTRVDRPDRGGAWTRYLAETRAALDEIATHEGARLAATAADLRAAGLPVEEGSVGSAPTAALAMGVPGVTECRPGNYVFHDASQVALGTCVVEDCALTIVDTVVSVPAPDRAVVDAGSKTLSSDPLRPRPGGYGRLLGRRSRIGKLSEEHGVVDVAEGESFSVGERVRILPNHACVVVNLHDRLVGVSGDRVEAVLPVAALRPGALRAALRRRSASQGGSLLGNEVEVSVEANKVKPATASN